MEKNLNLSLILQEPIDFEGILIYQPTITEMLICGMENFNRLLYPFCISVDLLELDEEYIKEKDIRNFDVICSNQDIFTSLLESLCYFCRSENITADNNGILISGRSLNRDNYDRFSEVILNICGQQKPQVEKPPEFKHPKGTKEWEEGYKKWKQIQENRKKYNKNPELTIEDMINAVQFGGRSYIPIEEIKKWTMWRLLNAYKTILNIEGYNSSFSVYLVSGEKSAIEKHWTELIKIESK